MRWLIALANDYRARILLGCMVCFAAFVPVGVKGRLTRLSAEVRRLQDENRRLREFTEDRFADLSRTLVAMRGYLEFLDRPAADSLPDGGGSPTPSTVGSISGYYCSAGGRDGLTVAPGVSWFVGDRTPYGVLLAAGRGWADFSGRVYFLDDARPRKDSR